jgi:nucleoside-diphosphate-sugar epimerase
LENKKLTICLTGATGWLGKSLIHAHGDLQDPHEFVAYGRSKSDISTDSGIAIENHKFDLNDISNRQFDVFAPFAFATREKALQMNDLDYISLNKELIADAVKVIRAGNVGSVLNISSGVVTQISESQSNDTSYSVYANLKRFQEEAFSAACDSVGIPLINCRVFSLSGKDMKEPLKYAIGNLVNQAITTRSIQLNSSGLVMRRYLDSRDLMILLLEYVMRGESVSIESGGEKIELSQLARLVLNHFNLPIDRIIYADTSVSLSNEYLSKRNDFERIAEEVNHSLAGLKKQIENVEKSLVEISRNFC